MRDKVQKLITDFDARYRRVNLADIAEIADLKSVEIVKQIKAQVRKRCKGQYELVCLRHPSLDDIFETAGLDDWMVDKAYDEFNKMLVELVGSDTTWVGPPDDLELLGLHFSDIPG
jgi:uncharacterized hydantoinase/oxoprolinase family protein